MAKPSGAVSSMQHELSFNFASLRCRAPNSILVAIVFPGVSDVAFGEKMDETLVIIL